MFEGFAPAQRQCSAQQWAVHSALMARLPPPRSRLNRARTLTLIPSLSSCVHYAKNGEAIERLGERTRLELDEFCTSDRVARGKLNCSSSNIYKYTWERLEIKIFINTVILVLEI